MSANSERIVDIFNQARAKPPGEDRQRFLDEACRNRPEWRAEIDSMLRAVDAQREPLETTRVVPELITEKPGDHIGRYKLLEKIGEGGMGTVWMAEQTEPVRRRVALKLIKQGMDSGQVLARFEAERQALALMDHPHIAKVLDAGAAATGRPYFVMELVKGIPLTKFCDDQRLSIRERLELFVPVCQAIQHAHQKGIIHRDIKPSNVLVAMYDGAPVPKVIDFGVAKAIGQQLTERTLFTGFGAVIGTLEYMSPEQAEFNQLDIDTRSDIYSLGVVLYELLTGTTPITRDTIHKAAFDEVIRRIREEEPPRPSTRLSESKDLLPAISAQRQLDPVKLRKLLRGDLDGIVMKCLEKDRTRRYETATEVAADVQHHLKNEPVMAGSPGNLYRLRKLVRRHKLKMAFTSALAAGFVLGSFLFLWEIFGPPIETRNPDYHVRAAFTDIQKLKEGDPVAMAGVTIGYVESIQLKTGRADVVLHVHRKYKAPIRTDSTAVIQSTGPGGVSFIAIDSGSSNAPFAGADTYLPTVELSNAPVPKKSDEIAGD